MSLYTERHGMRKPIEKTYDISIKAYSLLYDCCSRYYDYLGWKYPDMCPDGHGCCGMDFKKFNEDLEFEIPYLFRRDGFIDKPMSHKNVFDSNPLSDEYDQYSLLDLIEFVANNVRDIRTRTHHSYYGHDDISFSETNSIAEKFKDDINSIFNKTGLLYQLTENLEVERIEEYGVTSSDVEDLIADIDEPGLKDLLNTAIVKHKSFNPDDQKDAVEKIWDALERLKTYYEHLDKKNSVSKIINDMTGGNTEYVEVFNNEFKYLTDIGNKFRIRHHETNKIEITDIKHYDYLFNRCLSLIATAIQYLR